MSAQRCSPAFLKSSFALAALSDLGSIYAVVCAPFQKLGIVCGSSPTASLFIFSIQRLIVAIQLNQVELRIADCFLVDVNFCLSR